MKTEMQPSGANPLRRGARLQFCKPMGRHYMTKAAANAATALSMAKEIHTACLVDGPGWPQSPMPDGISELVQVINSTALLLIRLCSVAAYDIDGPNV